MTEGTTRTDVKLQCSPNSMAIVVPLSRSARVINCLANPSPDLSFLWRRWMGAGPTHQSVHENLDLQRYVDSSLSLVLPHPLI